MIPTARRLEQILSDAPAAASLLARVAASRRAAGLIAPLCSEIAPHYAAERAGACELRNKTLRLYVRSAAQSAKLRQAVPRLLSHLQQLGVEVSEIQLVVQPRFAGGDLSADDHNESVDIPVAAVRRRELRQKIKCASDFSSKLLLTLPESGLRDAVLRLQSDLARRVTRMRDSGQLKDGKDGKKRKS